MALLSEILSAREGSKVGAIEIAPLLRRKAEVRPEEGRESIRKDRRLAAREARIARLRATADRAESLKEALREAEAAVTSAHETLKRSRDQVREKADLEYRVITARYGCAEKAVGPTAHREVEAARNEARDALRAARDAHEGFARGSWRVARVHLALRAAEGRMLALGQPRLPSRARRGVRRAFERAAAGATTPAEAGRALRRAVATLGVSDAEAREFSAAIAAEFGK